MIKPYAPLAAAITAAAATLAHTHHANAQALAPVFFNDSPAVDDTITRAQELAALGNLEEAAAVIQNLLDQEHDRATQVDQDRWISVRARLHTILLNNQDLLSAYRARHNNTAQATLNAGLINETYTHYLLTPAGLNAALRIAEQHHDAAAFASAHRILAELERHPDRIDNAATAAATIATRVADFAGRAHTDPATPDDRTLREQALDRRDRWRAQAGLPTALDRPAPPIPPASTARSTFDTAIAPPDLEGMLTRPITSTNLSTLDDDTRTNLLQDPRSARRNTTDPNDRDAIVWYTAPTVTHTTILLNDGVTLAAFDRQTLAERWRIRINSAQGALSPGSTPGLDDLSTVIAHDGTAYAVSGLSLRREATPERVVLAVDIESGTVKWRTAIPTMGDPQLKGAVLRGRPILHEGVLTIAAVKQIADQRLVSVYLVGLDAQTGQRRWTTQTGSVGAARWSWDVAAVDHAAAAAGVIYRGDTVGAIAAVEAATGHLLWARAHPLPATTRTRVNSSAAENNTPVILGSTLYAIAPDRQSILAINRETGELIHEAPASAYGSPRYILTADGTLVFVRDSGIVTQPAQDFPSTRNRQRLGTPPLMQGRVTVAGRTLVTPTRTGIAAIPIDQAAAAPINENALPNLQRPGARDSTAPPPPTTPPFTFLPLERPGIAVPFNDQLIVADAQQLHTYSRWETARAFLDQRLTDAPNDTDAAVAYVQLAAQAGALDAVLPAIDRATQTLDAQAVTQSDTPARSALFDAVLSLIDPAVQRLPDNNRPARPTARTTADDTLRPLLTDRLARIASTPEQRAAFAIAAARAAKAQAFTEAAVDTAAQLLASPAAADAQIVVDGTITRARDAAIAVLTQRVIAQGPQALAAMNTAAQIEAQALTQATPQRLIQTARAYPLAPTAVTLWQRAADQFQQADRPAHAAWALDQAIRTAISLQSLGITQHAQQDLPQNPTAETTPTPTQLRAQRAAILIRTGRLIEAQNLIEQIKPNQATITIDNRQATPDQARAHIADKRSSPNTNLPTISTSLSIHAAIPAAAVFDPLAGQHPDAPNNAATAIVAAPRNAPNNQADWSVGLIAPPADQPNQPPTLRWTAAPGHRPVYLTPHHLIAWSPANDPNARSAAAGDNVILTALNLDDGSTAWQTPPLNQTLGPVRFQDQIQPNDFLETDTLLRSAVPLDEITYTAHHDTLIVARRDGSILAIDTHTGQTRWQSNSIAQILHSIDANQGIAAVLGSDIPKDATFNDFIPPEQRLHTLTVLDLKSGLTLSRTALQHAGGWAVITNEATVAVGTDAGVLAIHPFEGARLWQHASERLESSRAAVTMPGILLIRETRNRLSIIDTVQGTWQPQALPDSGRLDPGFAVIRTQWLGSTFAITTRRGSVIFDTAGELLGLDARPTTADVLPAAFTQNAFYTVILDNNPATQTAHTLARFRLPTGEAQAAVALNLSAPPLAVKAVHGALLVSTETETLVIRDNQPPTPIHTEQPAHTNTPHTNAPAAPEPNPTQDPNQ